MMSRVLPFDPVLKNQVVWRGTFNVLGTVVRATNLKSKKVCAPIRGTYSLSFVLGFSHANKLVYVVSRGWASPLSTAC